MVLWRWRTYNNTTIKGSFKMNKLLTRKEIKLLLKNKPDEYSKIWMDSWTDNSISLREFCKMFGINYKKIVEDEVSK